MTLTSIDALAVGSIVWGKRGEVEGDREGGMVVDFGLHADGSAYVEVLSEVPQREIRVQVFHGGAKTPKTYRVARLARINLDDIDAGLLGDIEPRTARMEGWANKALLGEVLLPGHPFELAVVAARLFEAAREVAAS